MTRSTTTIPFYDLNFLDHIPAVREVEDRLKKHLRRLRKERQDVAHEAALITEDDLKMWFCHACVPVSQLIYAAFRSNAKGLLPPSDEWRRRGL